MSKHLLATVLTTAVLSSGCATVLGGGASEFSMNVEEPRQDVEVRIEEAGNGETLIRRTPEFTVPLKRGSDYAITVRSPQYTTKEIRIGRNIRGLFWLNFLTVVPVGMIVDAATSNMWEHTPQKVNVRLEPARQGSNGEWVVPIVLSSGLSREVYEAPILK
jgi:hypothetical protein